ncbi:bifunctional phosphoribosyl-AMP cyclohydrolase/phosphoribosyl-ATP diphosphatase HisIE [Hippea maritima]|uniref:Histidine biosynthesis bifunctional protein HisIE n=1 Tax=Hippea maritima (strain ATCC 700847 / DSM 10411 / MH2) TaxID=760142 RepID=F2LU61_HIPMA|nr:bifunctional phosphoribosyl-AMP cyclohydrolase/phosphoribosyl-ATP diphosphatase HisIE [Hippea maritima]AEA34524.1 Phosphoribosyl-ATP pyrophosphatase [Hippea maritima DSM 10411]
MNLTDILKLDDRGLIPVITVDFYNNQVLMLAYANREAIEMSLKTGYAHYFSRSRNKLWMKGETSGHTQKIKQILFDCDEDTLLYKVEQKGAACHTSHRSCFYREFYRGEVREIEPVIEDFDGIIYKTEENDDILRKLYDLLQKRKEELPEGSYTAKLFISGTDKIAKKIGEEASEVIIALKNNSQSELVYESADLIFHLLVGLAEKDVPPESVLDELKRRFGISGDKEKASRGGF